MTASPSRPPARVRVRTGTRLHFGLIDPTGVFGRKFGGAGVILDDPGVDVEALASPRPAVVAPSADLATRVQEIVRDFEQRRGSAGPSTLRVLSGPREHVGLGTGTQLALAVAGCLSRLAGLSSSTAELAAATRRGTRSAIGIHGFAHGGFLIDGGKTDALEISPLVARADVPPEWRFLLAVPRDAHGLSGTEEREAFSELSKPDPSDVEALSRLVLLGLLPALHERDAGLFSEALHEFGIRAGAPFRRAQGGRFSTPIAESISAFLQQRGIRGTGQSSWGPTVYGLVPDEEEAHAAARRLRAHFGSGLHEVVIARPRNRGAEWTAGGGDEDP